MANVVADVSVPGSNTATQNVPGFSFAVSCGLEPAVVDWLVVASVQLVVPFGVPMPIPTGVVPAREFRVTSTSPACETVKVKKLDPPTMSDPAKASVVELGEGFVDDEKRLPSVPQPALDTTATTNRAKADRFMETT
jgi:hypothetical protein